MYQEAHVRNLYLEAVPGAVSESCIRKLYMKADHKAVSESFVRNLYPAVSGNAAGTRIQNLYQELYLEAAKITYCSQLFLQYIYSRRLFLFHLFRYLFSTYFLCDQSF
jgi:hypothetical protein